MNEAGLKGDLARRLRRLRGVVVYRHEDKFTGGVPDVSVTRGPRVAWIEVKYRRADGQVAEFTELQRLALQDLKGMLVTYSERPLGVEVYDFALPGGCFFPGRPRRRGREHDAVARYVEHVLTRTHVAETWGKSFLEEP